MSIWRTKGENFNRLAFISLPAFEVPRLCRYAPAASLIPARLRFENETNALLDSQSSELHKTQAPSRQPKPLNPGPTAKYYKHVKINSKEVL
jgi:hypothetical protein